MHSTSAVIGNRALNHTITQFFSGVARAYDTAPLQQVVYRPPQNEVVAELRAAGSRRIADIGCGTGILTSRIERELRPEIIYGIDASPGMLAQARRRSETVEWRHAAAEHLPIGDGELDAVVSTTAFHFFDHPVALREFQRVLTPGGLVAIATMRPSASAAAIQRVTSSPLFPAHAPSGRATRKLLQDAGFEVVDQRSIRRQPIPPWLVPDMITIGRRK
ncbi:class I SAM-dependent methyltransferase [Nocardia crassostreae]|uniref:class I SAM-dependent methyltransferase n=1 Tax=Nocardia crassostreae TaxID=53428 RepID=UPI0008374543|nr:class I SAM-dependent methyltransferase [Nocardia crassostreae]